jgi:hypothetical protein
MAKPVQRVVDLMLRKEKGFLFAEGSIRLGFDVM